MATQEQNQQQSIFEVIRQQFNIVDVAQNILGLRVRHVGNSFRADSIASDGGGKDALELHPETKSFYDWKLEVGGDVTELVALAKFNGDKREAIRFLMPDFYAKNPGQVDRELRAKQIFVKEFNSWHAALLNPNDKTAQLARDYLTSRGFTMETVKALKIGLMIDHTVSTPEPRIVFPYWDETGRNVIYFTSRRFPSHKQGDTYVENERAPKYKKASLNLYPFLRNAPMGLNTLKRKGKDGNRILVVTEGVCDWLAFYQEGYSVVASNGGGDEKFWKEILLKVGGFKLVLLAFDNDDAGKEFTFKATKLLTEKDVAFKCIDNLLTKDIAEYYQAAGNLDALINSAREGFEFVLESLKRPEPFEELNIKAKQELLAKYKVVLTNIALSKDAFQMHVAMLYLSEYLPKNVAAKLVSEAREGAKVEAKESSKEAKKKEEMRIINLITQNRQIIHDPRTGFYEYQGGRWIHKTDENIGGYVMGVLGDEATWSMVSRVTELIKRDCRVDEDSPVTKFNTLPLLSFKNGTLHFDVKTGEVTLKPHRYTDYNTVMLPYDYDPNAQCPQWLEFIEDITAGCKEAQITLQEFPGYALMPHNSYQKCLLLKGFGSNGKSVYSDIVGEVLGGIGPDGRGYVSHVEPAKFREQFRLMPFKNSFINISSDTESDLKGAEGVFKRIVAGEYLEDSYKFRDHMQFATRTKLIMCCNNFPITGDTSEGFMRRFLLVELPRHYVDNPRPRTNERKIDYLLKDRLIQELPGIFNWILQGMQRIIKQNGFSKSKKEEKMLQEFRSVNNEVYAFVEESMHIFFNADGTGKRINKREIFRAYIAWCEEEYTQPISARRFYSNLRGVLNSYGISFTEQRLIWTFDNHPNIEAIKKQIQEQQQSEQSEQEESQDNVNVNDDNDNYENYDDDEDEEIIFDEHDPHHPQYLQDPEEDNYDDDEEDDDLLQAK